MSDTNTAISKGSWVLITGITGHVASELAKQFLERGYKVRGTVRDLAKASWLVDDVFKSYADSGSLELVPVPDIAVDGGFDEAVKGISAIFHVATVGFSQDPNHMITPQVAAVLSLLKAAKKEPSVKRFVFTSSISAFVWLPLKKEEHITKDSWNDAIVEAAWAPPPYEADRVFPVYMASKVAAEKAFWKFVAEEKPTFVANAIAPQTIVGKRLSKQCASMSANILPNLYEGRMDMVDLLPVVYAVDVKDVALLHIAAALDPDVKNERIKAWGQRCTWNEMLAIMQKLYPDHKFIDEVKAPDTFELTADLALPLALLKKWGKQDGWRLLEETFADNMDHIPRK